MSKKSPAAPGGSTYYIGWDVGGWNCDKNGTSRDALVILDDKGALVGHSWRGNLRESIAAASTTSDWLKALFEKCEAEFPAEKVAVIMAIDTPLGFPGEFVTLLTGQRCVEPNATSGLNRYLFRHTERYLFKRGLKPLSAIKDMIGSQATKGMHVLAKFAPQIERCGVWTDGQGFHAIETYPTACRNAKVVKEMLNNANSLGSDDQDDARICALMAYLFVASRRSLLKPPRAVPPREGWIWVPKEY